jgi:hypothetical protein
MEDEARMPVEPAANLWVLVGSIVVENDMDDLAGRDVRLNCVEKANELLVSVALHAAAEDLAFQDVERGEQRRGAVPLVVVGHRTAAAGLER